VKWAPVGVGRLGTTPVGIPFCKSKLGNVMLEGVPGESVETSGVEIDMFLARSALKLDDETFFLNFSGPEGSLPIGREGEGAPERPKSSLSRVANFVSGTAVGDSPANESIEPFLP